MCVLSIEVSIQKNSGNLFNDPCRKYNNNNWREQICSYKTLFSIIVITTVYEFSSLSLSYIYIYIYIEEEIKKLIWKEYEKVLYAVELEHV